MRDRSFVGYACRQGVFLAGLFLLGASSPPGDTPGGDLGGFEPYQKAYTGALADLDRAAKAPSGPLWLQVELSGNREGCTSCHLGINDNRFLYARPPWRRHSGHYLEDHPPQRFGCTICHGGAGEGLSFAAAGHAPPSAASRGRQWETYLGWHPPGTEGMVPLASMAGRCALCHPASKLPRGAEAYRASRLVAAAKRCAACHRFRDEPAENTPRAVHLDHLGSKVGRSWLAAYLDQPAAFRAGTAMPAFGFGEGEARILATYLLGQTDPGIPWAEEDPGQDAAAVKRGREAVVRRRCQSCHDLPGLEEDGFIRQRKVGPSLAGVGEKLNPAWIRRWLADPQGTRPGTGMPRFRYARGEIDDIAAFLSSLRRNGAAPAAPGAAAAAPDPTRAETLAATYRCGACHTMGPMPLSPPERTDLTGIGPELFARLATMNDGGRHRSVEGPGGVFHRSPEAPRLFGPGESALAVLPFLAAQDTPRIPGSFLVAPEKPAPRFEPGEAAGGLVEELHCLSCHTVRGSGGDTGPDLTFAGSKLKRDWIVSFLQSPVAIRPMNRARMPHLGLSGKEAETLADWITSTLTSPEVDEHAPDLGSAFSFVGQSKIKSPYGCVACHRFGDEGGRVGPELTHVGSRLRTSWIYHWIQDPRHWIGDVRMPNFQMGEEDLAAITLYLSEQE